MESSLRCLAYSLFLFAFAIQQVSCYAVNMRRSRANSPRVAAAVQQPQLGAASPVLGMETHYFNQFVDHYNFMGADSTAIFPQRYLMNSSFFRPGGPMYVYAGNEGDITLFVNNTGFMFTSAAEEGALIVFIEHRYYGESLPLGNESYKTVEGLRFLGIEQALADYTALVASLKANLSIPDAPVIAWGGSYGGVLAAWWRIKYPSTVAGAIAASAPILQIPGLMDPHAYNRVITQTFATGNAQAPRGIFLAFDAMQRLGATASGRLEIDSALRLCGPPLASLDDVWEVIYWLDSAIGFMAMADYPYPASFLGPLPAYPAAAAGRAFPANPDGASDSQLLKAMADGIANLFYNFTGQAGPCFNTSNADPPGLEGSGWDVQCCREIVQPIGSYGWPSDMFWLAPFDAAAFIAGCQAQFNGTTPRPYQQLLEFGGADLAGASNIFFSNGELDPWKSGGIVTNETAPMEADVIAYVIEGGAHHLDLRTPNAADPDGVVVARNMERAAIRRWLDAANMQALLRKQRRRQHDENDL